MIWNLVWDWGGLCFSKVYHRPISPLKKKDIRSNSHVPRPQGMTARLEPEFRGGGKGPSLLWKPQNFVPRRSDFNFVEQRAAEMPLFPPSQAERRLQGRV